MEIGRSVTTMARVIGPTFAGLMFSLLGMDWPYYGGAVMMTVVVFLGHRGLRSIREPKKV